MMVKMSPLIERMRGLYEKQRLSGKLKFFLLLLLSVLVISGIAVWVSLSLVYVSNASLWAMERYADQVRNVESALLRFRSTHARADAQAARDHLARADVLFSELAGQKSIFKSPAVDEDILWLTRGFSEQLGVYLYYHEQSAALGSSVRQGGQGLLERLKVIEAQKWPERQAAVVASLVASTLKVRLLQQEYMHEADAGLIPPMRAALQQAIAAALELRRKAAQDEAGIEAYIFVQEAQSLGETFERFAAFSQRRNDNGSVLFQTTLRIVDWVNVATGRDRPPDRLDRQLHAAGEFAPGGSRLGAGAPLCARIGATADGTGGNERERGPRQLWTSDHRAQSGRSR